MRNKLLKRNEQTGFTIIEVVLVLAIAGLIFLIVFLALPQLQRSRRDTQRRSDVGRFVSALENYAGNNNGDYPDSAATVTAEVIGEYIGDPVDVWVDPSAGNEYAVIDGTTPDEGDVAYDFGTDCDGGTGDRIISAYAFQESGGAYCQDNR